MSDAVEFDLEADVVKAQKQFGMSEADARLFVPIANAQIMALVDASQDGTIDFGTGLLLSFAFQQATVEVFKPDFDETKVTSTVQHELVSRVYGVEPDQGRMINIAAYIVGSTIGKSVGNGLLDRPTALKLLDKVDAAIVAKFKKTPTADDTLVIHPTVQ